MKILEGVTKQNYQQRYDFIMNQIDINEKIIDVYAAQGKTHPKRAELLIDCYKALHALKQIKEEQKWEL